MPILTRYRPNFCGTCGTKIVRLRWRVWTSRRFCDSCAPRFRNEEWLQPLIVVALFLGLGFAVGRARRPAPPPLIIERKVVSNVENTSQAAAVETDDVYLCGARTKKGTPCSRRVHGAVRCWQHKGAKAMLPEEKLKIVE